MNKLSLMYNEYEKLSGADKYCIGVIVNHIIYVQMIETLPLRYLNIEPASRNQGDNLRLRISSADSKAISKNATFCLGSDEQLTDKVGHVNKNGKLCFWNRGEMFEKLVTEFLGYEWKKDVIRFDKCGDVRVNQTEIQIKLNGATLVNEKILGNIS